MNFNHLQIFHKVAEKEHFTRAAEELFISQPAVSKQVQELERELGQPLFEQIGRKIHLTEAGRILYEYANQIFALSKEAENALSELQGLERGRLTVGASMTIGTYLLPEMLGQFKALYPAIELHLDIANAAEIQSKVLANELELGLVEGFVTEPALTRQTWRQDELVLIDSVSRPLLKEAEWTIEALLDSPIPFILRETGSGTRAVLEHALEQQNLTPPKPLLEMNSLEGIKRAVAAGLGIAFVSAHSIRDEERFGVLRRVPLTNFRPQRALYLIYLRAKKLSRTSQVFIQLINKEENK